MKHLTKTIFFIALFAIVGKMNAQSDLLADNTLYNNSPNSVASLYKTTEDKIVISEFLPNLVDNTSMVSIKCTLPLTVSVKIFNMDGNMAKQEVHNLEKGVNEFSVNMEGLTAGTYMVQFYSKEGSAVRRYVKAN